MKVTDLLALLLEKGRIFNKKTRKQDLINAYLGTSTTTTYLGALNATIV